MEKKKFSHIKGKLIQKAILGGGLQIDRFCLVIEGGSVKTEVNPSFYEAHS